MTFSLSGRSTLAASAIVLGLLAHPASAQFTPGNLAVLRAGDGVQTLANTGSAIFIDQFSVVGSLINSVAIPASGTSALIVSGTATAEGSLTRSADGAYLTFGGYNTAQPFASSLPATAAATVPRGVGQVDANGNYALVTTSSTAFGGTTTTSGGLRGVVTDGNNNYWGVGTANGSASRGAYYFGTASAAGFVQTSPSPRVVNIFNGNLYYSLNTGISVFSGSPTTTAVPSVFITTSASSYDFTFNAGLTLAYIADDTASAVGGIQRWDFNGTSWSLSYTLGTGVANIGARGLAVDFRGANPIIYATTAESSANRLITISDTGAGSAATTLATAPANEIFRGLDFTPSAVPEPSSLALGGIGLWWILARLRRLRR